MPRGSARRRLATVSAITLFVAACGSDTPTESGPTDDGLVAHYPLDGNAESALGTAHGAVIGAVPTPDRHGAADSAMSFDGDGDFIEFTHDAALELVDDFTLAAWIDLEPAASETDFYTIFEKSDPERGGHSRYGVWVQGGNLWGCFEASDNSQQPCGESAVALPDDGWHHVAAVRSARRMLLYLDGVEIGDAFVGLEEISRTPFNAFIGADRYEPTPAWLHGAVDDVRVYDRALNAQELVALVGA